MSEPEWLTRKLRIDARLRVAGWTLRRWDEVAGAPLTALDRCAVAEYPTATGPADYALIDGGRVVGIVEAKRVGVAPGNVLSQVERYARGVAETRARCEAFRVPFLYATNGEQVWFEDVRRPGCRSRELAGFHTPEALAEALQHGLWGWLQNRQPGRGADGTARLRLDRGRRHNLAIDMC